MDRKKRLKLAELLGLENGGYMDDYVFQPVGTTAKIYIARRDSGTTLAGSYTEVDCRHDSLPSSYEDILDGLLINKAKQLIAKTEDNYRSVKHILEGGK